MDLKTLRKKKGLTQTEAADIVGLSRRGYQNLEMGTYKKSDSKTMQYVLGRLEELPNPKKRGSMSLNSLSRAIEDLFRGYDVSFAYFLKEKEMYRFVIDTKMDELDLLGLEEELSIVLGNEVSFIRFSSFIEEKEEAARFFLKAKRIFPPYSG